jgi:hypothetical protein
MKTRQAGENQETLDLSPRKKMEYASRISFDRELLRQPVGELCDITG